MTSTSKPEAFKEKTRSALCCFRRNITWRYFHSAIIHQFFMCLKDKADISLFYYFQQFCWRQTINGIIFDIYFFDILSHTWVFWTTMEFYGIEEKNSREKDQVLVSSGEFLIIIIIFFFKDNITPALYFKSWDLLLYLIRCACFPHDLVYIWWRWVISCISKNAFEKPQRTGWAIWVLQEVRKLLYIDNKCENSSISNEKKKKKKNTTPTCFEIFSVLLKQPLV